MQQEPAAREDSKPRTPIEGLLREPKSLRRTAAAGSCLITPTITATPASEKPLFRSHENRPRELLNCNATNSHLAPTGARSLVEVDSLPQFQHNEGEQVIGVIGALGGVVGN